MKKSFIFSFSTLFFLTIYQSTYSQDLGLQRSKSIGFNFLEGQNRLVFFDEFAIGKFPLTLGYRTMGNVNLEYKFYSLFAGAVANYHFSQHIEPIREKIDLYAGVTYGVDLLLVYTNELEFDYRKQPFVQVGGRYFITKRLGVYAQGNLDVSKDKPYGNSIELGITIKKKN